MAKLRAKVLEQLHILDLVQSVATPNVHNIWIGATGADHFESSMSGASIQDPSTLIRAAIAAEMGLHLASAALFPKTHEKKAPYIQWKERVKIIEAEVKPYKTHPIYKHTSPETKNITEPRRRVNSEIFIIKLQPWNKKEPYISLALPFVPSSLDWDSRIETHGVMSLGRNNPSNFHFTGAEDKLEFEIDWFFTTGEGSSLDTKEYRKRAMDNAKKLVSFSKANGYKNPPSSIMLVWGGVVKGSNIRIFEKDLWVITNIKSNLSEFYRPYSLVPQQIKQTITLEKMATKNPTTLDITSW